MSRLNWNCVNFVWGWVYARGCSIRVEKWTSLTEETENSFAMSSENDQLFTKYLIETS